jgi:hypothetical protein
MKQVYVARSVTDAHLVRGVLEAEGIAATVRGEFLAGGIGELPADVCGVWILDDALAARAGEVLEEVWRGQRAAHSAGPWTCPGCGERLEGQFTDCWRCGAARAAPA